MYTPWSNRYIGVEMEVYRNTTGGDAFRPSTLRRTMQVAGINVSTRDIGYYHSDGQTWDIKTDSSCGYEVASPKLLLDANGDNADLRTVCTLLAAQQARVTGACGLHVHVDCSNMNAVQFRRLVRLWLRYEPTWYSLVPASRRTNSYCAAMRKAEFGAVNTYGWDTAQRAQAGSADDCLQGMRRIGGRGGLNLQHYWHSARVEFRLHSGTIAYDKVVRWAALCASLVTRAMQDDMPEVAAISTTEEPQRVSIRHMGRLLGLLPTLGARQQVHPHGATLVQYFEARARQFAARA